MAKPHEKKKIKKLFHVGFEIELPLSHNFLILHTYGKFSGFVGSTFVNLA